MERIAIFGGSFDPVHFGHLWIAETALESLSLTQIRWIPAAQSPLKPEGPIARAEDRLQMLRLAISGADGHVVDDCEIRREGVSYTIDTVEHLMSAHPQAEILMVIGSDSLASMEKWHRAPELLQLVTPAVVQRGGDPDIDFGVLDGLVDSERIEMFRKHVIKMPVIELSSRRLRQRLSEGQSIRFRMPRAVEAFIDANKLYEG